MTTATIGKPKKGLSPNLVPGNPGNSGGKKGRSGRKSNDLKAQLAVIRDDKALPLIADVLGGEATYTLTGVCEHCGKPSSGPIRADVVKALASPDTRLRAADLTLRYTYGLEKTVRLEGFNGVREAFEVIKGRIRAALAADAATALIEDIQRELTTL